MIFFTRLHGFKLTSLLTSTTVRYHTNWATPTKKDGSVTKGNASDPWIQIVAQLLLHRPRIKDSHQHQMYQEILFYQVNIHIEHIESDFSQDCVWTWIPKNSQHPSWYFNSSLLSHTSNFSFSIHTKCLCKVREVS